MTDIVWSDQAKITVIKAVWPDLAKTLDKHSLKVLGAGAEAILKQLDSHVEIMLDKAYRAGYGDGENDGWNQGYSDGYDSGQYISED